MVRACTSLDSIDIVNSTAGQPVVWAISDKEDTQTLEVIFGAVKRRCPRASVTTIMSDDGMFT